MSATATLPKEGSERLLDAPVNDVDTKKERAMSPDRISRIRERAGWTLQEMGDTLGVTRQAVSAWERGVRTPTEYQQALLRQIEEELDARKQERQRKQFVQAITGLAAGAGIGALLSYLFNPNSGNSGTDEPTDQSS
jgi:DNA-binding transcriptional regulator YiaG